MEQPFFIKLHHSSYNVNKPQENFFKTTQLNTFDDEYL